ncbi:GNAT family N-acetyltransferase [Paenibacillus rhizovicinus]|uniref:GNAT family N-acetyltransferase n=1 Tax=Paenibacillus rhizovicinus TaxID=2704463 RepID=A0A6C0NXW2_9BACL|nr:GNAT family protein [Paenibacillus rhizovicinus]QHW31085.1 GNAT family N-acetyltransferase [Paenibacillus rhizovicinus]
MFPVLETERLRLREIEIADARDLFDCFSNPELTRYYGLEPFTNIGQAQQFVDVFAKNLQEKRGIRWGIEIKGRQGIIGTIGFNAWFAKHKRAEIGYELHPDHWRQGYAAEAVTAVIAHGFGELGLTRIGAVVFIENIASQALLAKLGFEQEGVLRKYMVQNGVAHDTNVYALIKP